MAGEVKDEGFREQVRRVFAGERQEPLLEGIDDRGHTWFEKFGLTCCRLCGIVQRHDKSNKPCRGSVHVGLREQSHD
jgi:hypothetical protein